MNNYDLIYMVYIENHIGIQKVLNFFPTREEAYCYIENEKLNRNPSDLLDYNFKVQAKEV